MNNLNYGLYKRDLESLKKILKNIESFMEEKEKLDQGLDLIIGGNGSVSDLGGKFLDDYIELAESLFLDAFNNISYYVFDCNMGKNPSTVEVNSDKSYKLDSPESLFQLLNS